MQWQDPGVTSSRATASEAGRRAPNLPFGSTGLSSIVAWVAIQRGFVMSRFIAGREIEPARHSWSTLEELRLVTQSRGCTLAQFKYAIVRLGAGPHHVASYLQRRAFVAPVSMG